MFASSFLMKLALFLSCLAAPLSAQDAQSPWERVRHFDANNDGRVSRDEFAGPKQAFDRRDSDADGFLTRDEAVSFRGPFGPVPRGARGPANAGPGLWMRIDGDANGKISFQEWTDFFKEADENADGVLQAEEWQASLRRQPVKDHAPAVGSRAPAVMARRLHGSREIDLAAPKRTTVLVFGSYT